VECFTSSELGGEVAFAARVAREPGTADVLYWDAKTGEKLRLPRPPTEGLEGKYLCSRHEGATES
jgi:hypothetical protein